MGATSAIASTAPYRWARAGYIPEHVILAAIPVLAGAAVAPRHVSGPLIVVLAAVAAVANEIGGRYINYLQDLDSGVDADVQHLPPQHPHRTGYPNSVHMYQLGRGLLVLFGVIVTLLSAYVHPLLLPAGLLLTWLTFNYAGGPGRLGHRGLAELMRFTASGLMAAGTCIVVARQLSAEAVAVGVHYGAFAVAGMTIQNSRDRDVDRAAGKVTLPARVGPFDGAAQLAICTVAAAGAVWLAVLMDNAWPLLAAVAAYAEFAGFKLTRGEAGIWRYYVHPRLTMVAYTVSFVALLAASAIRDQ